MITLEPLTRDQYPIVAEWEFGPQPENTDWAKYEREMEAPGWWHYGVYVDRDLSAHISLEQRNPSLMRFHVTKGPESRLHPYALADVLLQIADYLFTGAFEECEAIASPGNRAVARLAIRCGLRFRAEAEEGRRYSITKEERSNAVDQISRRAA